MNIKELTEKSDDKAEKFASKYTRKLNVVETDVTLSPEEKIVACKKLLKKLNKTKMFLDFKQDTKMGLVSISKGMSQGSVPNALSVIVGLLGLVSGGAAIATAGEMATIAKIFGGLSIGMGTALIANAGLNAEFLGNKISDMEYSTLFEYGAKSNIITEIEKRLKTQIIENEKLLAGNLEV